MSKENLEKLQFHSKVGKEIVNLEKKIAKYYQQINTANSNFHKKALEGQIKLLKNQIASYERLRTFKRGKSKTQKVYRRRIYTRRRRHTRHA